MATRVPNVKARLVFKQNLLFGLILKPVRLFCEHCDKYVPSDMEWRCSHCEQENVLTALYSFLNKCQKCKRSPVSYACPHCSKVNFLTKDRDGSHPARRADAIKVEEPPKAEDPRIAKQRSHAEQKEDLEREIVITRLNASLVALKGSAEFKKERSAKEKLEENFSEREAHVMGAHIIARQRRAENAVRYADDPELLQMADAFVKSWVESQT